MVQFQLNEVSLSYEEKEVLKDISFSIPEREFVGILGPNGCGKTTLLKLMTGVLPPTQGEVRFKDKIISDYSRRELARQIAVLPQDTVVDFPFTALEIVLMGRAPYLGRFQWETQRDLTLALEAMELTDCRQFADQDIRQLSGGERERVLLARALAQEPEVLLLDEPTTHLDLKHQAETFHLLKRLHEEKKLTLVVVLHDLNFAAQACERLLILGSQKLLGDGHPIEVLTPEKVEGVFGVPVLAGKNPEGNVPWIFPRLT